MTVWRELLPEPTAANNTFTAAASRFLAGIKSPITEPSMIHRILATREFVTTRARHEVLGWWASCASRGRAGVHNSRS